MINRIIRSKDRLACLAVAILLTSAFVLHEPDEAWAQVTGSGTQGKIPKWTSGSQIGDSVITESASGNIGIGTSTPGAKLEVSSDILLKSTFSVLGFWDTNGSVDARRFSFWNTGGGVYGRWVNDANSSVVAESIFLKNNGNLGIGTTSPVNKQHIFSTAPNDGLSLDGTLHPGMNFRNSGTIRAYFGLATGPNGFGSGSQTNDLIIRTEDSANGNILFFTQAGALVAMKIGRNGDVTVAGNIAAKYQDIAEWVPSTQTMPAGTVVVLDPNRSNHVLASSQAYDTRVAGVISEKPGVTLGEGGEGKLLVATTGRVRIKVDASRGPIRVGDLLVTSEKEGIAMRSDPVDLSGTKLHRPGTIIGKALEPLENGVGEILTLLSLQ